MPYEDDRIYFKAGFLHVTGDPAEGPTIHLLFFRGGN